MADSGWLLRHSARGVADLCVDNFEHHTEGVRVGATLPPLCTRSQQNHGFVASTQSLGYIGVLDKEV
jgi:hypothetical protein